MSMLDIGLIVFVSAVVIAGLFLVLREIVSEKES